MRRGIKYTLLIVLVLAVCSIVAAVAWVFNTTEGARWVLEEIPRFTSVGIRTERVNGTLARGLDIEGLHVSWSDGNAEIKKIGLLWSPAPLLLGRVTVTELSLEDVRIQDNSPEVRKETSEFTWPSVKALPSFLFLKIDLLAIKSLRYQRRDEPPWVLNKFTAKIIVADGNLNLQAARIEIPQGSADVSLTAGMRKPRLSLDMQFVASSPIAGIDRFTIRTSLFPAPAPEYAAGRVDFRTFRRQESGVRSQESGVGSQESGVGSRILELTGTLTVGRRSVRLAGVQVSGPGAKGSATGEGEIRFTSGNPLFHLHLNFNAVDLRPIVSFPTDISGSMKIEGNADRYRGEFTIANKGEAWHAAQMSASFEGGPAEIRLTRIDARWLGGLLAGNAKIIQGKTAGFAASLKAREMNPAAFSPQWGGKVNADLTGSGHWSSSGKPNASFSFLLHESRVRGKAVTGEIKARLIGANVLVDRLLFRGDGFSANAKGNLSDHVDLAVAVSDLSLFMKETKGSFELQGRVRQRSGRFSGSVNARGKGLLVSGMTSTSFALTAAVGEGVQYPFRIHTVLSGFSYNALHADTVSIDGSGTVERHEVHASVRSSAYQARVSVSGSYSNSKEEWNGEIADFSGRDAVGSWVQEAPASVKVSPKEFSLSPFVLHGGKNERLALDGDIFLEPLGGSVHAEWRAIDLSHANAWLEGMSISGESSGSVRTEWPRGGNIRATAAAETTARVKIGARTISVKGSSLKAEWNERGMSANAEIDFSEIGKVLARLSSPSPAGPSMPDRADVSIEWDNIDLGVITPWFTSDLEIGGRATGRIKGKWLPGERIDASGQFSVSKGIIRRRMQDLEITAEIKKGELNWSWRGESLDGDAVLVLGQYGETRAKLSLPLPARLPVSLNGRGPVRLDLEGKVRELGLLTALFPGIVQDSRGQLEFDMTAQGTWDAPLLKGTVLLDKAGGYFPPAGIHVKDVRVQVRIEPKRIIVESLEARSGPGSIKGSAEIDIEQWQVRSFKGKLTGDSFEALYLPEARLQCSPQVEFQGTPEKVTVTGEITIPEFLTYGPPPDTSVKPSTDVVLRGGPRPGEREIPIAVDLDVKVILGKHVLVKAEGADAQLGGTVELKSGKNNQVIGSGEITVVKGRYSAYGVTLDIKRGRVLFVGGPVENPGLDVLALRSVGTVKAGVIITGTARQPLVKLYSEPAMQDVDTLAYIVLGHPLGGDKSQGLSLMQAAGFLLSAGQSATMQDQVKQRLGVDTLDIETQAVSPTPAVTPGQQPTPPTETGAPSQTPSQPQTGPAPVTRSLVTIGKYLTPNLYVSYGRSLFTAENEFLLRYSFSRHWEVETKSGIVESGVDLYYKIDFD